jgi:hypothetical protein
LTAPARADVSEARVGTKKRAFRSNKETDEGKKMRHPVDCRNSLTSPIQGVTELIGDKARPVPIGPELLANLDEGKRLEFLKRWQTAMKGQ